MLAAWLDREQRSGDLDLIAFSRAAQLKAQRLARSVDQGQAAVRPLTAVADEVCEPIDGVACRGGDEYLGRLHYAVPRYASPAGIDAGRVLQSRGTLNCGSLACKSAICGG